MGVLLDLIALTLVRLGSISLTTPSELRLLRFNRSLPLLLGRGSRLEHSLQNRKR